MAARNSVLLVWGMACVASVGCCGCLRQAGCTGPVYGGVSCGCADEASCSCPAPTCGLAEASCCAPETVGCGTPVVGQCRLLQRIRNALRGCRAGYPAGCACATCMGDWQSDVSPAPTMADPVGSYHGGVSGRRQRLARRQQQLNDNLLFTDEAETNY